MSKSSVVYGSIEVRQCRDKRWRKGIGAEIVDAPQHVEIVPTVIGKRAQYPYIQVGPNEIVTVRGLGRTVAYRMERESFDDRTRGVRRAVKVYDDEDAK